MAPRNFTLGAVLVLGMVLSIAYWKLTAPPLPDFVPDVTPPAVKPAAESEEQLLRRRLLGVWQDEYQGKRTMTLTDDGKGTMLVELSGLQATLFAPRLRFDMQWTLNGKKLKKKTVGGEPADRVNLILNTMGNTAEDTILEVSEDRLLLLDKNGSTKYDWKRAEKTPAGKK